MTHKTIPALATIGVAPRRARVMITNSSDHAMKTPTGIMYTSPRRYGPSSQLKTLPGLAWTPPLASTVKAMTTPIVGTMTTVAQPITIHRSAPPNRVSGCVAISSGVMVRQCMGSAGATAIIGPGLLAEDQVAAEAGGHRDFRQHVDHQWPEGERTRRDDDDDPVC